MTQDEPAQLKRCSKCGVERPLAEFGWNRGEKDGRGRQCKTCNRAYYEAHYTPVPQRERKANFCRCCRHQLPESERGCVYCAECKAKRRAERKRHGQEQTQKRMLAEKKVRVVLRGRLKCAREEEKAKIEKVAVEAGKRVVFGLSLKEKLFCEAYTDRGGEGFGNPTKAAQAAGYSQPHNAAWRALRRNRVILKIWEIRKQKQRERRLREGGRKKPTHHTLSKYLERKYGITIADYNHLFEVQGSRCAICERHQDEISGKRRRLVVDHDHATGDVRALLCNRCNLLVGFIENCNGTLDKARDYLARHASLRIAESA